MIICLDTETTGLKPSEGAEIIQLSIVQCDGDFVYDEYFCPVNSTEFPDASDVTGLYYDEPVPGRDQLLRDCPPLSDPETHDYIQSLFDSCEVIVGYNLEYDINMLEWAGFDFSGIVMNDPMHDFRDYYISEDCPDFEAHREALWKSWINPPHGGYKSVKLIDAAIFFGYDPGFVDDAHNSLYDVQATIFVWENLNEMGLTTDMTRDELAEKSF